MNYITGKITAQDKFNHAPQLRFKGRINQKTLLGGFWSILLSIFIYYQWFETLLLMFTYKKSYTSYVETEANFDEVGKVLL